LPGTGAWARQSLRRLIDSGHQLTVWNRTPTNLKPLLDAGATAAASPKNWRKKLRPRHAPS